MLLQDFMLDEIRFKDYQTRLRFDETLLKKRAALEGYKAKLRSAIAVRYELKRPEAPMIVLK